MLVQNPFANARSMGTPGNISTPSPSEAPKAPGTVDTGTTPDPNAVDPNKKVLAKDAPLVDPVEQMERLWENDPVDPNNPNPAPNTFLPAIDPKKLSERLGTVDFKKSLKPEMIERIKAGGDDGIAAMLDVMSDFSRQAMMTGFMASHKMVEAGLTGAESRFLSKVPDSVTDVISRDGINSTVAAAKDPRFAPVIDGVREQFQRKFPKASPSDISKAVNKYIKDFMDVNLPKETPTPESLEAENKKALRTGSDQADWEQWFESDPGRKQAQA